MIPKELQERKQWVCWRYEEKPGRAKPTKVPYDPVTGAHASTMNPDTWTDYKTAVKEAGRFSGIGFVFTKNDPYIGIDLDHVLDKEKNFCYKDAEDIFERCESYTEISPSGTGIHIIAKGTLSPNASHKVEENEERGTCEKEIYDSGRFFTVTGNQLGGFDEISEIPMMVDAIENMIDTERQAVSIQKSSDIQDVVTVDASTIQEDPVITYTKEIFPELEELFKGDAYNKAVHDKAVKVAEFIEKTDIIKVKKGQELSITYQQGDRERTAIIYDQGPGFTIPNAPGAQKKYLFTKLIRQVDRENQWEIQKQPCLENMHKVTQFFVSEMSKISAEAGYRSYFGPKMLESMFQKPFEELQNEVIADIGRAPELSKAIAMYQSGNIKGFMVSKNIVSILNKDVNLQLEDIQEMPSNTQKVKEENMRPVLKDAMISTEQKANLKWMQDHGMHCYVMKPEELSSKMVMNCSMSNFHVGTAGLQNTSFEECCFDYVTAEDGVVLKNVSLTQCRIGSEKDFHTLVRMGAHIKDCQVFKMDEDLGKKRWHLVGLEKPKLIEPNKIACKSDKEGLER